MIIKGNTVTTTVPRPDYAQTNPQKGDFIKNKPDAAIEKAQKTADAALPKAGGTMAGPVDMGGNHINNIPEPTADHQAVNKGYVTTAIAATRKTFTAALPADGWSAEAPYTQTVAAEGVLASDMPHYGVVYSEDLETAKREKEAFSFVDDLETAADSVTFTCFEDKPEVSLTIQMEVNR